MHLSHTNLSTFTRIHLGSNKANIINALKWLASGATAGDSLFFHYSGHGGTARDLGMVPMSAAAALPPSLPPLLPFSVPSYSFFYHHFGSNRYSPSFSFSKRVTARTEQKCKCLCLATNHPSLPPSFLPSDGDEVDNFDETILPVDFEEAGQILDDEIHVRREGGRE